MFVHEPYKTKIHVYCCLYDFLNFKYLEIVKWSEPLFFSNSIMHILYMDPVYSLLQMVNVLSKTFKLITDFTSKSFTVN